MDKSKDSAQQRMIQFMEDQGLDTRPVLQILRMNEHFNRSRKVAEHVEIFTPSSLPTETGGLVSTTNSAMRLPSSRTSKSKPKEASINLRIRLRAFEHRSIDLSAEKIVETARRSGARVKGPSPLPTRIRRFTVIRGPHIDKESMEHFELRTHNRLIDIQEPTKRTIDALMRLDLPSGVDIQIKIA